ncbi:MAG: FliM/FliN family flagellar motor switch protein [Pirellulales bacterium]
MFLDELQHAWENVLALNLSVERVESNPQLVQIVPPNEVVILISFELTLQETRGMMNLCIPFNSIERIGSKLTANSWVGYGRKTSSPESLALLGRGVKGALVEMVVRLADTRITTGDLIGLRVGDIITTEKDKREDLTVLVEGVPKFHAKAGACKGRKAIQIERAVAVAAQTPPVTAPVPTATPTPAAPAKKK